MKTQNRAKLFMLLGATVLLLSFSATRKSAASSVPKTVSDPREARCIPVGGTILTNFNAIDANTTMGSVTGDLRGAVSGTLLGAPAPGPGGTVVFHVQHHWVTESGETLYFDPATATTVPLSSTLFAVVSYPVHLTGGTGRFTGATGDMTSIGEVDLSKGTVFRYSGQVCFGE